MPCKLCGSANQKRLSAEMGIHLPELKNIDKPVVWVFPVVVCSDCGTAEFAVPEAELRQLAKGDAAPVMDSSIRHFRPGRQAP
jgi:hypothetical protein